MSKCCAEVELGKWPQRDWTDLDLARSQLTTVTTKADLLAALQFSLFLWSNPVALFASFDPVCLCFPFPSPPPHPRLQDAQLTLHCVGFPASGRSVSLSTSGWHTGSWPLCVFTNHSFPSASLPQAAGYCSCGVFLTAFPHKFNTTTPLVQNKRGELAAACKKHRWGRFHQSVLCHRQR